MTRTNERHRSLLFAGLIVVAAAIGTVGAVGTVGAQDAENETDENASEAGFYSPSADDPLNARFRDCCANTIDSVDGGVLNLNIVYDPAEEPYDVNITAPGLSDEQVDGITYGPETDLSPSGLDRTDIVGMNFSGVETGEYEFVVSVVGADAATTVPLEITGESGTDEESNGSAANETTTETTSDGTQGANGTTMANETTDNGTMANETEMGAENGTTMANETMANETMDNGTMDNGTMTNGTNVSVVAEPSAANATLNVTEPMETTETDTTAETTETDTTRETTEGGTEATDAMEPTEDGAEATTEASTTTRGTTASGATTGTSDGGAGAAGDGTATDGAGEETTEVGGPGFTLVAGVVALVAAALIAARRD